MKNNNSGRPDEYYLGRQHIPPYPKTPWWEWFVLGMIIAIAVVLLVLFVFLPPCEGQYLTNQPAIRVHQVVFTNGVSSVFITNNSGSAALGGYTNQFSGVMTNNVGTNGWTLWNTNGGAYLGGISLWLLINPAGQPQFMTSNNFVTGPWWDVFNSRPGLPTNITVIPTGWTTQTNSGWYAPYAPSASTNLNLTQ